MNYLKIIENSLKKLVENDINLIERKLKEECINHCFAKYIEQEIGGILLSVDLEYDKNYEDRKKMILSNRQSYSIRPDIIVHKRLDNNNNEIYIECKKNYLNKGDKEKLIQAKNHPYNYKFSIGVCYLPKKRYMRLWVVNNESSFKSYKFDKTLKRLCD